MPGQVPPVPGDQESAFSLDLPALDTWYKWSYAIGDLLGLASFTQRDVVKGHPHISDKCQFFIPFNFFSCSVVSDSLQPHGLQHARLSCPSPSPRDCSKSCPLSSRWCHATISTSVNPFSSCLQSFPASGSFPVSWLFTSGGQSIGTSASVLPIYVLPTFGWFMLISGKHQTCHKLHKVSVVELCKTFKSITCIGLFSFPSPFISTPGRQCCFGSKPPQ